MKGMTRRGGMQAIGWLAGLGLAGSALAGGGDAAVDVRVALGTDPATACNGEAAIEVVAGSPLTYCFIVTNLGSDTLRWHSLDNDVLAVPDPLRRTLIDLPIQPGASAQYRITAIAGTASDRNFHWTSFPTAPAYTVDTAAPFDVEDIAAGATPVTTSIALPFPVTLYGRHFPSDSIETLCVYGNGAAQWVQTEDFCGGNFPLFGGDYWNPPPPDGNDALLPYWDALGALGTTRYAIVGEAPARRFVVEWRNRSSELDDVLEIPCAAADPADCGIRFQMLIDEADGAITFSYLDVHFDGEGGDMFAQDRGGSAMIGLVDTTRALRQIVSVEQQSLHDGQSIRFEPAQAQATAFAQVRVLAGNPQLRVAPGAIAARALVDDAPLARPLTLRNLGDLALDWSLAERAAKSHFPLPDALPWLSDPAPPVPMAQRPSAKGALAPVVAYAVLRNALDGAPYRRLDATEPSDAPLVRQLWWDVFAGDFIDDDFSRHLLLMDTAVLGTGVPYEWGFGTLDTATGDIAARGTAAIENGDGFWQGMAWDRSSSTLYALASTCPEWPGQHATLYTLDPDTGSATRVARIDPGTNVCLSDIAISPGGAMYAVDVLANTLYAIDKATGEAQAIGPLGFNVSDDDHPQLDYDDQTGVLYFAGTNNDIAVVRVGVYTLDTGTGAATYVGPFAYNTMSYMTPHGFAIARPGPECLVPGDTPWLQLDATRGTTPAAGESLVGVTLDPTGLAAGIHRAELCVTSNDRAAPLTRVPVTFTVAEPGIFRDDFDGATP